MDELVAWFDEPVDEFSVMEKLPLTFTQAQILIKIWKSDEIGTDNFPNSRSIRQHIYIMRPRLRPFGITILSLANKRYGMSHSSRNAMDKLFHRTS